MIANKDVGSMEIHITVDQNDGRTRKTTQRRNVVRKPTRTLLFLNETKLACSLYIDGRKIGSNLSPWKIYEITCDYGTHKFQALRAGKRTPLSCTVDVGRINSLIVYDAGLLDGIVLKGSQKTEADLEGLINGRYSGW